MIRDFSGNDEQSGDAEHGPAADVESSADAEHDAVTHDDVDDAGNGKQPGYSPAGEVFVLP